jgi:uncharacterized protein (DUF58 family)
LPQAPLNQLKQEAAALASELGTLTTQARAASAAHLGSASRRRSGSGENFWQYRRHTAEDGAHRIDWRRSAREENLFVRETELETSRTFLFWVDPSAGFNWSGEDARTTKADRGLVIAMGLAGALGRSGERCAALGGGRAAASGPRAPARMGEDLRALPPNAVFPPPPRVTAAAIIISDFYAPMATWRERLSAIAGKCRDGVLLQVFDPIEADFPFEGRVRLYRPGEPREQLIGRAETVREEYIQRFGTRRSDMQELARELGWRFVSHSTADDPRTPLREIAHMLTLAGAAA